MIQFFVGTFLVLAIIYIIWITICSIIHKKFSLIPCFGKPDDKMVGKVKDIAIFGVPDDMTSNIQYFITFVPPKSFGNDDPQFASFDWFLWKGKQPSNVDKTTAQASGTIENKNKNYKIQVPQSLIEAGSSITVIIVTHNRFASSGDAYKVFELKDVPVITDVRLVGYNVDGKPIMLKENVQVEVTLDPNVQAIDKTQATLTVVPLAPQTTTFLDPTKCSGVSAGKFTCDFDVPSDLLYGGTQYIPSSQVANEFGPSQNFISPYQYFQQKISPGAVTDIQLQE